MTAGDDPLSSAVRPLRRVAMVSVHGCPLARPGRRSTGGMNVYLKQLATLLAQDGLCVDVFTRAHDPNEPEVAELGPRARVIHLPAGAFDLPKEAVFEHLPEFLERLESFASAEGLGYDLLHSHYWLSGWVGQRLASSWTIPHIVTFHTLALVKQSASSYDEPLERQRTELELATGADGIVAFTPDEQESLVEMYGARSERIHIAPGGVDLERFQPQDMLAARRRLGLPLDDQMVLYVGRLDPFKGPHILLRAFSMLRSTKAVRLVFVGGEGEDDPEALLLKQLAAELGVASQVQWQSAVPQHELVDYYNAADIHAMSSYHESFGLAALEAMACGTPVVATRVGALRSLVLDGRTGCLVNGHAPEALAGCLQELLTNDEHRRRLGEGARQWASQFPWSRVAAQLRPIYEKAVGQEVNRPAVLPCVE